MVLVLVNGEPVKRAAYGRSYAYQAPSVRAEAPIAMSPATIFDIASITKVFTATAVAQLVERGQVDLDAPVARYLPEAMGGAKTAVTVRQLLIHTSGFPAGPGLQRMALGNADAILKDVPLQRAPGTAYTYSDLDLLALGRVVEAASGLRLDEYMRRFITEPLGLAHTGFRPQGDRREIAATEYFSEPLAGRKGLVWGAVHDSLAWSVDGVAGHAGLFSTAEDLATFGQMMLAGGAWREQRVLSQASVAALTARQYAQPAQGVVMGLGWELNQSWYMGGLSAPTTFGHTGFTGTSLVVSPSHQTVAVLLTNRLHPTPRGGGLNSYRQGVASAVAQALGGKF